MTRLEALITATRDSDLSPGARLLWVALALRAARAGRRPFEATKATLSTDTGQSTRTIQRLLADLVQAGWIQVELEPGGRPLVQLLRGWGDDLSPETPDPRRQDVSPQQDQVEPGESEDLGRQNVLPRVSYSEVVDFLVTEVGPARGQPIELPQGQLGEELRAAVVADSAEVLDALRWVAWGQGASAETARAVATIGDILALRQRYAAEWRAHGQVP